MILLTQKELEVVVCNVPSPVIRVFEFSQKLSDFKCVGQEFFRPALNWFDDVVGQYWLEV